MIVRLMGEGQWQVDESLAGRLHELDGATERAVEAGDQEALHAALSALAEAVRSNGERLADDHLAPSDLIVPPVDLTLDEARDLMHGEGLIPEIV
jgi:hypothetical protein